eukprot:m.45598 g.45598  ORF g.45598 m.45598 type:complete len:507 (-) comp10891_c1_seq1:3571-5091(-)
MDKANLELASAVVGANYATQAENALRSHQRLIRILLEHKKLPEQGWSEETIELFLHDLAAMDSNNFLDNVGLGEREARIASGLVSRMHFRLGHGVGRSGDIAAIQPKAAGSSLMARLAECMMLDLLQQTGMTRAKSCIILPLATGMSIVMTLLTLRLSKPQAKYIVWSRIDQKTCLKAIVTAGYTPLIVEQRLNGDQLETDMAAMQRVLKETPNESIACVITTTSCFAPRAADDVVSVSLLCKEHGIPHVINNAYGVQIGKCMHEVNEAMRVGRVDAVVQSTDKNFLVPVGGAVIASQDKDFVTLISKTYPGRASGSPVLDLFITMLSLGSKGYKALVKERKENFAYLTTQLKEFAASVGERVLSTPGNKISLAVSLEKVQELLKPMKQDVSFFGSMLFSRRVSGTRVVSTTTEKTVAGISFKGYGAHHDAFPVPYMTAAAAVGMKKEEVDQFVRRLDATFSKLKRLSSKATSQGGQEKPSQKVGAAQNEEAADGAVSAEMTETKE